MIITRKSKYALRILAHLAAVKGQTPVPSRTIATQEALPPNLIPQIAAQLSRRGWVTGQRGVGGGLTLAVAPETITVWEVIKTIEGVPVINSCLLRENTCPRQSYCHLRPVFKRAQKRFFATLDGVSIADLSLKKNSTSDHPAITVNRGENRE